MPRLSVRDTARADIDAIASYIAQLNLDAALRFYDAAESAFQLHGTRVPDRASTRR